MIRATPSMAPLSALLAGALTAGGLFDTPRLGEAPYPPSPVIESMEFDFATHVRLASGSDNWPLTWGPDDHLYTSWGDGGGFSGTNERCRVSLGFARIEGAPRGFRGRDLWGDSTCAGHPARFGGKTRTILSLGGTLYFWRSPGSELSGLDYQALYRSRDRAATWESTSVLWTYASHRLGFFAFLQFGRDYAGARDEHVYIYAGGLRRYAFGTQKPGELFLMRVPRDRIEDQRAYEFFMGRAPSGDALWGRYEERQPVFTDPNGVMRTSAAYNPGLRRYLLVTNHSRDDAGNVAVFDAPEPWGPWTTVLYATRWPRTRDVEPNTFFAGFSPKWWSDGGRGFVWVFTGRKGNDSFNSVEGRFRLARHGAGAGS